MPINLKLQSGNEPNLGLKNSRLYSIIEKLIFPFSNNDKFQLWDSYFLVVLSPFQLI